MVKSSIMIDLDDPRSDKIAEAITNKTSKKVLTLLTEGEMSGSEIAGKLSLPLNTIGYNLKKLTDAGLIETSKKVFWSSRGKKMNLYRISNRKIVISPKRLIRGILPTALLVGIVSWGLKIFVDGNDITKQVGSMTNVAVDSGSFFGELAVPTAERTVEPSVSGGIFQIVSGASDSWAWFLIGGLTALFIFLMWNFFMTERRETNGK